jgi:Holliday junction resolvase RusA-like endonuclease
MSSITPEAVASLLAQVERNRRSSASPEIRRAIGQGAPAQPLKTPPSGPSEPENGVGQRKPLLSLTLTGQISGAGKNNLTVTRRGQRIPPKRFQKWSRFAIVEAQIWSRAAGYVTFEKPVDIELTYVAGDKRKRDMPSIIDGVFHVLEKAGIVADDSLIWVTKSSRAYDKENPRVELRFFEP